ncbi:MAG: hypothetical protein BGP14_08855 [Sphingobacteriales bacterium 44-15]|nr:MAG: hypothetical protein BGP14_08855 [Sphingobacteriales bacterium 44-15]
MIFTAGYQTYAGTPSPMNKAGMIMKLMIPLLLFCIFQVNANSYAQKITIVQKNLHLTDAFRAIEKQTGFLFFYDKDLIQSSGPVDILVRNATLEQALSECLKNEPLTFRIVSNTIVILPKAEKVISSDQAEAVQSDPPPVEVTGTVTDKDGKPLEGASVLIKGTKIGTTVNRLGTFSLTVPSGDAVLVFSFVGMKPREVKVGDQTLFNVVLEHDVAHVGDAIVVTALGITRSQRALGYSVGEVSSDQLSKVPQENAVNALTGKVAGLKVGNPSPDINSDPQVIIRGAMSLSGDDAPLIVIDGLPTGNSASVLSDISSTDIESVSVLKGPSAAALYGSRAGNGVLLVTTKSGKGLKNRIGVSVNSSVTTSRPYHFIKLQDQFANGRQGDFDASQDGWYGPAMGTPAIQWNSNGVAVPLKPYPDNAENFVKTGYSFINEVGIRGSGEKTSFNLSISDTRAKGTFPGLEMKKDAIGISFSYKLIKDLKVSANARYISSGSNNFRTRSLSLDSYPFEDVYMMPNYIDINEVKDYWKVNNMEQNVWDPGFNNPWFTAYQNLDGFQKANPYGNVKLDWNIIPDLSLMTRVGTFSETYTTTAQRAVSDVRYPLGRYNYSSSTSQETNMDFLLSYKKKLHKFSGNISGGGNYMFRRESNASIGGENLILPGLFTAGNVDKGSLIYNSEFSQKRVYSLYGMASFDYDRMVYLELTGRNDWSSTLPPDNRSYFYPSASLSLILSDMLHLPSSISLLKLRGGWARVGKDTGPYQLLQVLDRGTWGDNTRYSLQPTMANTNLKPESVVSSEVGLDLSLLDNRLSFDATYYQVEDRGQIMSVQVPTETGFLFASTNAGTVRNKGVELKLNAVPVKTSRLTWDMSFVFTKDRSRLVALPEGISTFRFWSRFNAYSETQVGGDIGDIWGNDVLRVKEGKYKDWPIVNDNGLLQLEPERKKIGNVISDFTLGFQTSVTFNRFSISANFDWRQGGKYFSESMMRLAAGGKLESWHKGPGSSTFTGILNQGSFGGDQNKIADEIRNNPDKYNGLGGLTYVGGRTEELGGYLLPSTGLNNGVFFPGVRYDAGSGDYVENFGGLDTRYTPIDNIAGGSGYSSSQGVQTWMYDASFLKMRELALTYNLSPKVAGSIKAQNLALSFFMRNLIIWTKAKNGIDPESAGFLQNSRNSYSLGWERSNMDPWTAMFGLKLNVEF